MWWQAEIPSSSGLGFRNLKTYSLKIDKPHHVEANQDIKELPRQICNKLPKASFKHFNSKKNAIRFYTNPFKDLSLALSYTILLCVRS